MMPQKVFNTIETEKQIPTIEEHILQISDYNQLGQGSIDCWEATILVTGTISASRNTG
jgi:hypothetical protein